MLGILGLIERSDVVVCHTENT